MLENLRDKVLLIGAVLMILGMILKVDTIVMITLNVTTLIYSVLLILEGLFFEGEED